jgi:hypothetical protein
MHGQASCAGVLGELLTSEYPAAAAPKVRRLMSSAGQVAAAAGSTRDSGSGSAPRPSCARRRRRRQLPICRSADSPPDSSFQGSWAVWTCRPTFGSHVHCN